jgi:hypothetical protein
MATKSDTANPDFENDLPALARVIAKWTRKAHDLAADHLRYRQHDDHAKWSRLELACEEFMRPNQISPETRQKGARREYDSSAAVQQKAEHEADAERHHGDVDRESD